MKRSERRETWTRFSILELQSADHSNLSVHSLKLVKLPRGQIGQQLSSSFGFVLSVLFFASFDSTPINTHTHLHTFLHTHTIPSPLGDGGPSGPCEVFCM